MPHGNFSAQTGHFLHRELQRQAVRRQKECFSAPKVASGRVWCTEEAFPVPGAWGSAGFGVKKSVFLHQKLPPRKNGAQMGHFLHRNHCWQAVRCQKECFPAPKVASGRVWCTEEAFPAPGTSAAGSSASKRVYCCAGIPRGRGPAFFCTLFSLFLQNGQYRIVYRTEADDGAEAAAAAAEISV